MRIALLGAGSIGTIIGALMSRGGEDIVLVNTNQAHVDALNRYGARIVGFAEDSIPVTAIRPEAMTGRYDLIISLTKLPDMAQSLRTALPHMHAQTIVLNLQNGFPEEISREVVGAQRVMGGCVEFSATGQAPGVVEWTSQTSALAITFGPLDGRINDRTRVVQKCLARIGMANMTGNLPGVRYAKLTDNATFSAMSAILACNFGQILDSYEAMRCIAYLGREAARIIAALGIQTEAVFGLEPTVGNLGFASVEELHKVIFQYWPTIYTPSRPGRSSMLQDLEKGRKSEIDYINGQFVALGRKLGIGVPFMQTAVAVIKSIQDREQPIKSTWENLKYFQFLLPDEGSVVF